MSSAHKHTERWARRVGGAGLFKLHINFSRATSACFLSLFRRSNESFHLSLGVLKAVRLDSIELGNLYEIVEFCTLCSIWINVF